MFDGRQLLLGLYYHASYPYRLWRNGAARRQGRTPIVVLFYHRVADDAATPWTCPTATFARQVRWLKRHFDLISLAEVQRRMADGFNDRPAVSITFDDGYQDNCRDALPLLIDEQVPCTYFVATQIVLEQRPFPHDAALGYRFAPNTLDELRSMAAAGVEIGSHTRTHADLGTIHDADRLRDEIVASRVELAEALNRTVRHFAFPYGLEHNLNAAAFAIAKEAGYESVCSAYGGFNFPGDDPFHIHRVHGDTSLLRLKNWLSVDPRKERMPRYDYKACRALELHAGATNA